MQNKEKTNHTEASPDGAEPINRVKDIEKPEPDIYDPWKAENLALPQEYLDQRAASALLNSIAVNNPSDQTFVRVHPSDAFTWTAALITHQEERNTRYFIHPVMMPKIGNIKYHLERLFLYTNRHGGLGFWPVKMPTDFRENTWLQSKMAAVSEARKRWVCVISNMQTRSYTTFVAEAIIPEPDWDEITQGKDVHELLKIAFRDRLVLDETHPLIKKLRGSI
jgi:hypothetical protein